MMVSLGVALDGGSRLVEQRRLLHHFHLAADAALGADIGVGGIAAAVRAEIGLGLDERPRIGDDVEDALIEPLGRDRLGQEFGDAGVARHGDAALLGMAGQHDDGGVGIALGFRLPDHLRELEAVENRHRPVGDDDVGNVVAVHFQRGGAVLGLIDFARAERMQQRSQDAAHMRIVVANEKSQLVEVDAKHGLALGGYLPTVYPALTISRRRLTKGCDRGPAAAGEGASIIELLAQDALFQAVAGVEQHPHRDGPVGKHLDPADVARLVVVGHRRHRALVALEHLDHHDRRCWGAGRRASAAAGTR